MHPVLQQIFDNHQFAIDISERNEGLFNAINEAFEELSHQQTQLTNEVIHLKAIQKVAKAGSWEVDLTEGIHSKQHYWSDELFNILGIEPGSTELTYHRYLELIHPDDRELFEREVNRAITTKSTYEMDYRIVSGNGVERMVRDVCQILVDQHTGRPLKMVGVTFDITEAKVTENALLRANSELQTLFDNIGEVFWSADMIQYKVLQMSPACKQVYGYEPEEMMNDPDLWFKVILEDDKPLIQDLTNRLNLGQTVRSEYRIVHKDGRVRWLEAKMTPP